MSEIEVKKSPKESLDSKNDAVKEVRDEVVNEKGGAFYFIEAFPYLDSSIEFLMDDNMDTRSRI